MIDVIAIAKDLISFPSITPGDHGAFDYVIEMLSRHNFTCHDIYYNGVRNLYAVYGQNAQPNICFAGHLDVVAPGDIKNWKYNPFTPIEEGQKLYGRGASDMKCAVAAWIAAMLNFIHEQSFQGSISLLLTGDEEGDALFGTVIALQELEKLGIRLSGCIVGEPTSELVLGDTIKIGRRGSVSYHITVYGKQGHVAYPQLADNPINRMVNILYDLQNLSLDNGTENFQPSSLQIVNINVNSVGNNIIPNRAEVYLNIRFNNLHSFSGITEIIKNVCKRHVVQYHIECKEHANAFLSQNLSIANTMKTAIGQVTGNIAKFSTSGGTSDARFIHLYCPVAEFGLRNLTAHQVNEHVEINDILSLESVYYRFLWLFFAEQ